MNINFFVVFWQKIGEQPPKKCWSQFDSKHSTTMSRSDWITSVADYCSLKCGRWWNVGIVVLSAYMCRLLFGSALLCALSASTFFVNCNESRVVNGFDLNDYHSFNEIVRYVNSVQNDRLSVEILGFSSEQLPIPIVKVTFCWRLFALIFLDQQKRKQVDFNWWLVFFAAYKRTFQ
jgi:hypothetical protein